MKIAVVSDIHGNLPALEAVLADLKSEATDVVVNLGDCVSGPLWPEETAQLLMEQEWPTVRGNHDRQVLNALSSPETTTDGFSIRRLSETSKQWLASLQPTIRFSEEIFLCHGTPTRDNKYLTEQVEGSKAFLADEATIAAALEGERSPLICCGHTHIPRVIRLTCTGQTIVNPGSIGLPAYDDDQPLWHKMEIGSPHARYAIMQETHIGWFFYEKVVTYDWEKAAQQAELNGRPTWAHSLRHGFFGPLS
ncbi:metallophosphoesterase family protein [Roseibium sediminis]|uniref:metallophosphoesterase family protein n=1 Tax=Roseibium sediminis TaxID=1775174 RepID=UPI00123E12CB|nr:metallophosphoesterase family protein [Roseibium sediminis]